MGSGRTMHTIAEVTAATDVDLIIANGEAVEFSYTVLQGDWISVYPGIQIDLYFVVEEITFVELSNWVISPRLYLTTL